MPSATLRGQLLRWLLVPLSIIFLLDAAGSYVVATRLSAGVYDGQLTEIARELSLHVRRDGAALTFDLEKDAERTLLLDPYDEVRYVVRTAAGAVVAGDAGLAAPPPSAASTLLYDSALDGRPARAVRLLSRGPDNVEPLEIDVVETKVKRDALAKEVVIDVILPQLLLILLAGVIVWAGVTRGLAPLRQLRHAISARSHLDLTPVRVARVPGEVDPLLQSVNELMARLDEILSFQSRFIADAAHQMRTPVAGLKAHIELALRETDPVRARQSLAHLYTSVERISRLVAQLLSLARNEGGSLQRVALAPIDLGKLAFDIAMEWVPEAYRKRIDLGFEGASENVTVLGDAGRLNELLNNLLDNAVRYSREAGRITVRVTAGLRPRLSVSDDGPTIPVAERQRVFERFHRLMGGHVDGSGLGLAIVREIAALHGAEIALEDDTDGVGNTFIVSFPSPADAAMAEAAAP